MTGPQGRGADAVRLAAERYGFRVDGPGGERYLDPDRPF